MLKHFSIFIFSLLFITTQSFAQSGRIPVPAKEGMVASVNYIASEVGSEILQQGGNAIDATVATALALAVVYPSAGNIGGGGFIVYHKANGDVTTFNFREKAPAASTARMFLDEDGKIKNNSNHAGPLAVGVPGTVAGLWDAHKKYGSLPWKTLVQPAVDLAEKGFPTSWNVQGFLKIVKNASEPMYKGTKAAFLKEGKEVYEPGELFQQPDLAETMKRIRDKGRDGFYKGKTAKLLAKYMKEHGGIITTKDLADYQPTEQAPIKGTYRGYDVYGMPPPSSGGIAVVEMLNILEGFDLGAMGHNSAQYMHTVAESMRRAFSDRAQFIGDPIFNPDMPISTLTSKSHAKQLRSTIDLFRASESDSANFNKNLLVQESEETTHFSVVDKEGNAVSLTYTLEYSYGSRLVAPGTGFILNNEMGDFNPIPGYTDSRGYVGTKPNLVEPGKRMLSSMAPMIIAQNGKPYLVFGSPGGRTIINTSLQIALNVLDHGMNMAEAIEAPRMHHQWFPNILYVEGMGFSPDTKRILEMMGHKVEKRRGKYIGQAAGIMIDPKTGIKYGSSDSRSYEGSASGY